MSNTREFYILEQSDKQLETPLLLSHFIPTYNSTSDVT